MEPVDDILIPPSATNPNRLRGRHVLRFMAFVLMAVAAVCGNQVYRADALAPASQRTADIIGVGVVFFFGVLLWWFGGRKTGEMSQPVFRCKSDAPGDLRIDRGNILWVAASLLAGFIGLTSVTFGALLALRREVLMTAYPFLRQLNLSPKFLLMIGGLLVFLSIAALGLAMRRRSK
jgi:hypothetical protein